MNDVPPIRKFIRRYKKITSSIYIPSGPVVYCTHIHEKDSDAKMNETNGERTKQKRKTGVILPALLVMALWGSLFPMVKLGYGLCGVDTALPADILLFAGIRFTVCGAVICAFSFFRGGGAAGSGLKTVRRAWGGVLLSGIFSVTLHYSCTYLALGMTASSKTAIIKQIGTLLYVCCSFLFFRSDRLTVYKLVGAGIGFLGIIAINLDGGGGFAFGMGDVLILGASFCTVISNVISKKIFDRVEPIASTGVSQLFGGLILLFTGLFMGGSCDLTGHGALPILLVICAVSVVSYCVWYVTVRRAELSKLFIIKFTEPLFACVFSALLLQENILRWQYLAAFVLIAGGILISHMEKRKK